MNSFLRNRTPSRQFGLLLVFVFGTLLLAASALGLSLRDAREDGAQCWRPHEFNIVFSTFLVMSAGRLALGVTSLAGSVSGGLAYSDPAAAMTLIACVSGSSAHLVMNAPKRGCGITHMSREGKLITDAAGLLDQAG